MILIRGDRVDARSSRKKRVHLVQHGERRHEGENEGIGPSPSVVPSPCNWKPCRGSSYVSTARRITGRFLPAYRIITGMKSSHPAAEWNERAPSPPSLPWNTRKDRLWGRGGGVVEWKKGGEVEEVVTKSQVGSSRGVAHSWRGT